MKYKLTYLLLFILAFSFSNAQPDISFAKTSHNFGEVDNLDFRPAAFVFTNTGNKSLVILKIDKNPSVKTNYPKKYILSGEQDTIFVKFISNKEGRFFENMQVHTNASDRPIKLSIKGNNIAAAQCDENGNPISLKNPYMRDILVIDRNTRLPVQFAEVHYLYNASKEIKFKVNHRGKATKELKVGLYETKVSAENYKTHYEQGYIRKSIPKIVYELVPLEEEEVISHKSQVISEEKEQRVEDSDEVTELQSDEEVESSYAEAAEDEEVEEEQREEEVISHKSQVISEEKAQRDEEEPSYAIASEDKEDINKKGELSEELFASNNIVFLVDVSLSMKKRDKLKLLQYSMNSLIDVLRKVDKVSLISFSNKDYVLLKSITGDNKKILSTEVDSLKAFGMTNGVKGLAKAYEMASDYYIQGGNNQIILSTDGQFNSPEFSERELISSIKKWAEQGIIISLVGFGNDEESIKRMKKMARFGKGSYIHISKETKVDELLIDEIKKNSRIVSEP